MFRILGFITGSSIAALLLLSLFDPPQLTELHSKVDATLGQISEAVQHDKRPTPAPAETSRAASQPITQAKSTKHQPATLSPSEVSSPEQQPLAWQPFWKPFRSELSALGFASRIARLSGREVHVEQSGSGRYQAQFAYRGEPDRRVGLALISSASGLPIEQGTP